MNLPKESPRFKAGAFKLIVDQIINGFNGGVGIIFCRIVFGAVGQFAQRGDKFFDALFL